MSGPGTPAEHDEICTVLLPAAVFEIDYEVGVGEPYSTFHRLLLTAVITSEGITFRQLQARFGVHLRLVLGALLTLVREGWVNLDPDGERLWPSEAGKAALASKQTPRSHLVRPRHERVLMELATGQVARASVADWLSLRQAMQLFPQWEEHGQALPVGQTVPLRPSDAALERILTRPGGWIRRIAVPVRLMNLVYLPVQVLLAEETTDGARIIGGLPRRWSEALRRPVTDVVRATDHGQLRRRQWHQRRDAVYEVHEEKDLQWAPATCRLRWRDELLVVGAEGHRALLARALDEAVSRIVLVSTFIGFDAVTSLRGPLLKALERPGLTIDLIYGAEPTDRRGLELLKSIEASHRRTERGGLRLAPARADSHAKVLWYDTERDGERVQHAWTGSYNWLSARPDSKQFEVSVELAHPRLQQGLARALADLCAPVSTELATELGWLAEQLAEEAAQTPEDNGQGVSEAALLLASDHLREFEERVGLLCQGGSGRLLVISHRVSLEAQGSTLRALRVAARQGLEVRLAYGLVNPGAEAALDPLSGFNARLEQAAQVHAKVALIGKEAALVSSCNWLSAPSADGRAEAAEIGLSLRGPAVEQVERLISAQLERELMRTPVTG